jgi:hypothetical protein
VPRLALGKDIDDIRTKTGIERVVLDVLRRVGLQGAVPARPRLTLMPTEPPTGEEPDQN